ncbi:hypothetical protein BC936DRAFT_147041 [Jimgerdemannia flammicorona]|uniref:Protein kinase domain-containing protein n=1 Tax=Jimgerdemannia flammicorona TaxID=994334 RepID=A0A433D6C1_9FUNG|nr:hypothetical protein BC936DRAFT_147041 [Jimgerdemannia flammicorona]
MEFHEAAKLRILDAQRTTERLLRFADREIDPDRCVGSSAYRIKLRAAKILLASVVQEIYPSNNYWGAYEHFTNKFNFPNHEKVLEIHLNHLLIPELVAFLVWIPFDRFVNVVELGKGGFATVYKGTVRWPPNQHLGTYTKYPDDGPYEENYALKEILPEMATEVSIYGSATNLGLS